MPAPSSSVCTASGFEGPTPRRRPRSRLVAVLGVAQRVHAKACRPRARELRGELARAHVVHAHRARGGACAEQR
jgi:hypothetical protein